MSKILKTILLFSLFFTTSITFARPYPVPKRLTHRFTPNVLAAFGLSTYGGKWTSEYISLLKKNLAGKPINDAAVDKAFDKTKTEYAAYVILLLSILKSGNQLALKRQKKALSEHLEYMSKAQKALQTLLKQAVENEKNKS